MPKTDDFTPELESFSLQRIGIQVAGRLLESTGDVSDRIPVLTLGEIASLIGTTPEMVNKSLESLQKKGAIRLEHRRIVINRALLQKIATHEACGKDDRSG